MSNLLFIVILFAIAAYVLYAAIVGKGRLYNAEFIKAEMMDKFKKTLRLLYLALGIVMLLEVLVMAGQQYLFENGDLYFAESYYEADGTYHEITSKEIDGEKEYYEIINGKEVPVATYSMSEFQTRYYDAEKEEVTVTKNDPTKPVDETAATPTPAPQSNTSALSCLGGGTASTTDSNSPMVGSRSIVHKKETILSGISYNAFQIMNYVFMGLSLLLLVGLFLAINKMTDKEKKAKARTTNTATGGLPSDAFNFDEDDK